MTTSNSISIYTTLTDVNRAHACVSGLGPHQGELALLVGPSGSGKTTLLNLVAALDRPDCGEIIVGGADVTGLSRSAAALYRNERVGFIFQSYNLLPQLTALENILVPMLPKRRSDLRRAEELLDAVGLGDHARHRPSELSGGEQQRVAIARAQRSRAHPRRRTGRQPRR